MSDEVVAMLAARAVETFNESVVVTLAAATNMLTSYLRSTNRAILREFLNYCWEQNIPRMWRSILTQTFRRWRSQQVVRRRIARQVNAARREVARNDVERRLAIERMIREARIDGRRRREHFDIHVRRRYENDVISISSDEL